MGFTYRVYNTAMPNGSFFVVVVDFAALFPRKGTTDYVVMQRRIPALQAVTGCMWTKSSSTDTNGTPFSYAVPGSDNELLLLHHKNLVLLVDNQWR